MPWPSELTTELELIASGQHGDPHRVLGRHGGVVRAYRPDAVAMRLLTGRRHASPKSTDMTRVHPGRQSSRAPIGKGVQRYQLEADYDHDGQAS